MAAEEHPQTLQSLHAPPASQKEASERTSTLRNLHIGDRVKMTDEAVLTFKRATSRTGVVTRIYTDGRIEVRRDGIINPGSWGADFWELDA